MPKSLHPPAIAHAGQTLKNRSAVKSSKSLGPSQILAPLVAFGTGALLGGLGRALHGPLGTGVLLATLGAGALLEAPQTVVPLGIGVPIGPLGAVAPLDAHGFAGPFGAHVAVAAHEAPASHPLTIVDMIHIYIYIISFSEISRY